MKDTPYKISAEVNELDVKNAKFKKFLLLVHSNTLVTPVDKVPGCLADKLP